MAVAEYEKRLEEHRRKMAFGNELLQIVSTSSTLQVYCRGGGEGEGEGGREGGRETEKVGGREGGRGREREEKRRREGDRERGRGRARERKIACVCVQDFQKSATSAAKIAEKIKKVKDTELAKKQGIWEQ